MRALYPDDPAFKSKPSLLNRIFGNPAPQPPPPRVDPGHPTADDHNRALNRISEMEQGIAVLRANATFTKFKMTMDFITRTQHFDSQILALRASETSAVTARKSIGIELGKAKDDIKRITHELLIAKLNSSDVSNPNLFGAKISNLEKEVVRLKELGKKAVEQRLQADAEKNNFEARAVAAEQKLALSPAGEGSNAKYQQLKRFIALEFHPDHSRGSTIEKAIRTETFKFPWPKVDKLERV